MKRTTGFTMGDRYAFDFRQCTSAKGWAQLDTKQDASYFGNWVNPTSLEVFSYCEGDTTLIQYESEEEFKTGLLETLQWYEERDGCKPGLDPGFNPEIKAAFERLGRVPGYSTITFADWLH